MSRIARPGFQIGRGTGVCASSGRPLVPGEPFVAVLLERPGSEDLDRQDFSQDAWAAGHRPAGRTFASWRGVVPSADAKKRVLIDDAALLDIFEQLAGQTEPRRVAFRFVLALILIRKRILACETTRGTTMLVRVRRPGQPKEAAELSEVTDPGLDDATITEVMDQLSVVMAGADMAAPTHGTEGAGA